VTTRDDIELARRLLDVPRPNASDVAELDLLTAVAATEHRTVLGSAWPLSVFPGTTDAPWFTTTAAAAAGIVLAARASIGSPTAGQGLELSAITVVVVGGTSLLGGRGSLIGTLGGVLLLALTTSSTTLLQLPSTWMDLVRGVVTLVAAAVFVTRSRR